MDIFEDNELEEFTIKDHKLYPNYNFFLQSILPETPVLIPEIVFFTQWESRYFVDSDIYFFVYDSLNELST